MDLGYDPADTCTEVQMSRVTGAAPKCCSLPTATHLFIYSLVALYNLSEATGFSTSHRQLQLCRKAHIFTLSSAEDTSEACHCLLRQAIHYTEAILRNIARGSCIALHHKLFSNPANSGSFIKLASGHRSCSAGTPLQVLTP